MKIAIDAMGGDNAPQAVVKGALRALDEFSDLEIELIGNESLITPLLEGRHTNISIFHTEEKIENDDEPVRAVRRKKNASMVIMAERVRDKKADACISAGNTGALMTAGLFIIGRINGIDRPALAPTLPTLDGKGFVMLDVGANADAKMEHLEQYAIMGSVYAEKVRGIKSPRVGLLNIGTEEKKGNELAKQAFQLLSQSPINFVGNVEARDLLKGAADVVVTDGFSGNIALKAIEGTALSVFAMMKEALTSSFTAKIAAAVLKPKLKGLKKKMDYSEHGGACLFGLKAPVIKAHGSSDELAIFHAIRQAQEIVANSVSSTIEETIQNMQLKGD